MTYESAQRDLYKIWVDLNKNPLKTVIILLVIFLFLVVGAAVNSYVNTKVTELASTPIEPQRAELSSYYRKVSDQYDASSSVYTTIFAVFVHTPPYWTPKDPKHPEAGFSWIWRGDPGAQCTDVSRGFSEESAGAYSSSTKEYEFTCKTYRPILDNGYLFTVKEN